MNLHAYGTPGYNKGNAEFNDDFYQKPFMYTVRSRRDQVKVGIYPLDHSRQMLQQSVIHIIHAANQVARVEARLFSEMKGTDLNLYIGNKKL